jgi:hypothetical protein
MPGMGGMRLGLGTAFFAVALTACAVPEPATEEPHAAPSPTQTDAQTRELPEREKPVSRSEGGARFDVPDAVILEQLRRAAERIAQSYTAPPAPAPVDVDPRTNRGLGYHLLLDFGFAEQQWQFLDALWHRESGWNHLAENPSSGAYGIPQSLPANKMAVVGDDWRANPETQIRWGLAYIAARYGTPERAWQHSERVGWY